MPQKRITASFGKISPILAALLSRGWSLMQARMLEWTIPSSGIIKEEIIEGKHEGNSY
jgi:hypothetical protein